MSKSIDNEKYGKKAEKVNTETTAKVSTISNKLPIVKTIEITIKTIENVTRKDKIILSFSIEHDDVLLGESNWLEIEPDFKHPSTVYDVNFTAELPITVNNPACVKSIVSIPVLIKAAENNVNNKHRPSITSQNDRKSVRKISFEGSEKTATIIGICSIDLVSIMLNDTTVNEKYLLETLKSENDTTVSWQNLPVITIDMKQRDPPLFSPYEKINFLTITVESIYNLPESFTDETEYKTSTIVYTDQDIPTTVIFEGGKWVKYPDVERMKCWNALYALKSRAKYSKYALNDEWANLKNPFKKDINFEKKVLEDKPTIEWNSMHRCILLPQGSTIMEHCILKYRYWPFHLTMTSKTVTNSREKLKETLTAQGQLYQCYVDLTELLFPGITKTRVVAQLHTYSEVDMVDGDGLKQNAEENESLNEETESTDSKNGHFKGQNQRGEAIFGQNGEPVVIIVEVELHHPLIASEIAAEYSNLLDDIVPIDKRPLYVYSEKLAEEHYSSCIKQLADTIARSYQDYREEISKIQCNPLMCQSNAKKDGETCKYCFDHNSDELTCFTQYLHRSGIYLVIHNTLKSKVTLMLDQKFHTQSINLHSEDIKNFIPQIYTYLVEQMHTVINEMIEGRQENTFLNNVTLEKLHYYGQEAYELGDVEEARNYFTKENNATGYVYLQAIALDNTNPDTWVRYAIFLIRISDIERSIEACREAIYLDVRHQIALLIYGAILLQRGEYRQSEIFLRSLVEFYPYFAEGWTVLHLFYVCTQYYPGIDLTLRVAQNCMVNDTRNTVNLPEPFNWFTMDLPHDSVYVCTICLLLKLHLCELAGIALANELASSGKSKSVLYYMAVQLYLTGRYDDSLGHLETLKKSYGLDCWISSLLGHCYFQRGDLDQAMHYYEFTSMMFDKRSDMHLIYLRMGIYLEDIGEYQRAKKVLLRACKSSPTCRTWLYAGIVFYHLNELKEAEAALLQANNINNLESEVWGYLCLVNMSLRRYNEFTQCYKQAVRNNLKSVKLWMMISDSMEALNYTCPILAEPLKEELFIENMEQSHTLELK